MAQVPAVVSVEVKGLSKLDKVISKASQLENIVANITRSPLEINVAKATNQLDSLDSELKGVYATIANSQRNLEKAGDSINSYASAIAEAQTRLSKLNPNTVRYNQVLKKQQDAIKGLAQAQRDLKTAESSIESSESQAKILANAVGNARRAKQAAEAINQLADDYLRLGAAQQRGVKGQILKQQLAPTISQLKAQADGLQLVASNSRIASSEFNRFAISSELASQKLFDARQKQLGALAFGLSGQAPKVNIGTGGKSSIAGARNLVTSAIGSYGQITKSEAALSSYAERLRSLQSLVPYTSNEFRVLEEALAGVNQELSEIGLRGQKSAIQTLSGPATDLGSLRAFQLRESFQKKVNDQLNLQDSIQERISQATLFDFQKKKLTLQLDEAVAALAENRLGDAQRLTREIDRQRISMERMNRAAQKPQVFGALGTAFLPVTGEMPGGALVSGSPAAKAAEAKSAAAEAKAAVALAKKKQKAIEDEAKELRKSERAATALNKQKLKALDDEAKRLRQETSNAVALAQQKMREEERAIAQAWKMRGGPALPPSMGGGTAGVRGQAFRAGGPGAATAALNAPKRVESLVRSTQLAQEKLLELEIRGVDVSAEKASAQRIINSLKASDLQISDQLLNNADDELNLIRDVLRFEKQRLTNKRLLEGGGSAGPKSSKESGFRAALTSEEIGAKINQIVSDFNKVVSGGGKTGKGAGANVVSTLLSEAQAGVPKASAAGEQLGKAVEDGLNDGLGIQSPSKVAVEAMLNVINTLTNTARSGKAKVQAALKDLIAPDLGKIGIDSISETLQQGKIENIQEILPTSLSRSLAPRNAPFQTEIDPAYLANVLGSPLTRGRPSPAGIFPAPAARVGAPGSAFPFQTYNMSYPQFPAGAAAQLKPPSSLKNRPGDTSRILSAAIKEYRAAIDNFWEGEDSQFEAIKKIVVSSGRLAAAQLARRLQQAKDLTLDQQFQQTASEARSLVSGGQQSGISRFAGAANDLITGERRLGISSAISSTYQRISDSLLNSLESLGFTVSDGFRDAIDRVRNAVPSAFSSIAGMLPPGGFGGGRGGGGAGAGGGAPQGIDDLQRALGLGDLAPIARATNEQLEELARRLQVVRNQADGTSDEFVRLGRQLGTLGREQERRAPDAGFLTRRLGPRGARAASEGLIGGAFPLLFGQGIGAAALGGLGGAAGGFAGGGLGFGLSLVGTALGTAFDQLNQAAQETGKALRYPIEAFDQLKEKGLLAGRQQEYYISKLIEAGKMTEAAGEIQAEIIKKIGVRGVEDLRRLGDSSSKLSRAWAEFSLQLQTALAGPMAGLLKWLTGVIEAGNSIGREAARQGDIASGLSPGDLKRLQAEEQRILSGANLFNEAAKRQEVAQLYSRFESSANINAPAAQLTPEQLDAQKKAQGVTKELQAQVELQRKQLSLTGLTLERDGARYVNAAKAVALQEYENKLLEIKNSWIGQIFDKEQNLAKIRSANLEYAAKLKQVNEEVARRQEEVYRNSRQAELAFYQEAQKRNDLTIRIAEFNEGEEAGLRERLDLSEAIKQQKLSEFKIEAELAMIEAHKNGTALQTAALNANRLSTLESELDLENKIAYQKFAQLQLNKFLATEEAKRQAVDPFVQFRQSQQLDQQYAQTYHRLLTEGIAPAEAKRLADFERLVSEQLRSLDIQVAIAQSAYDEAVARGILGQELKDYADNLERVKGARAAAATNAALGAGPAVEEIPGAKIQEFISTAEEELKDLEALAIRVSQSIGDAVGNSLANGITGLVEGTTTAKQVFADFLKEVGQILVREGTKMIATYIAIGIAKIFAGLSGGSKAAKDFEMPGEAFIPKGGFKFPGAADGAYFASGVAAFANGGMFTNSVVSSPTLFKFADGGAMRTGVMGEAGPEAIMPLSRGSDGRLGVDANGLREAMSASGGSSSTPMLNMTFETTSINGVEYVSRDQLEAAMAATRRQATKDGAKQGMNMTLDRLQQSPKTRSRVGLR